MEVEPKASRVSLTKLDAGLRQLDEAIRMFFERRDMVAIHTLAAAASEVLHDLAQGEGVETLKDLVDSLLTPEGVKAFRTAKRKAQNFFKHSDRAGQKRDSTVEFSPQEAEFILFDAVKAAGALGVPLSEERRVFAGWFYIHHPYIVNRETAPPQVLDGIQDEKVNTVNREVFRELIRLRSSSASPAIG